MRRSPHAFRPRIDHATLEDRVVPSTASGTAADALSPLAARVLADRGAPRGDSLLGLFDAVYARQFRNAFRELATTLADDAQATLYQDGAEGIASNRSAFDAQVGQAVASVYSTLSSQLLMSPLSQKRLLGQVQGSLAGSGTDNLLARIGAIPSPTDTSGASAQAFREAVDAEIVRTFRVDLRHLAAFFSPDNPDRKPFEGGGGLPPAVQIHRQYVAEFNDAFSAFSAQYAQAVGVLLAPATNGTSTVQAQIAANRPTFDAQVQSFVEDLSAVLTSKMLLSARMTRQLVTPVFDRLVGGTDSLANRLTALTSPTATSGDTAQTFGQEAASTIYAAFADVLKMLNGYFGTANVGTAGTGTGGSTSGSGGTSSGGTSSGGTSSGGTGSGGSTGGTSGGTVSPTSIGAFNGFGNVFSNFGNAFANGVPGAPGQQTNNSGVIGPGSAFFNGFNQGFTTIVGPAFPIGGINSNPGANSGFGQGGASSNLGSLSGFGFGGILSNPGFSSGFGFGSASNPGIVGGTTSAATGVEPVSGSTGTPGTGLGPGTL